MPCRVLCSQGIAYSDRAYFAPAHGFLAAFTGIFNKMTGFISNLLDLRPLFLLVNRKTDFNRINRLEDKIQKVVSAHGYYSQRSP